MEPREEFSNGAEMLFRQRIITVSVKGRTFRVKKQNRSTNKERTKAKVEGDLGREGNKKTGLDQAKRKEGEGRKEKKKKARGSTRANFFC